MNRDTDDILENKRLERKMLRTSQESMSRVDRVFPVPLMITIIAIAILAPSTTLILLIGVFLNVVNLLLSFVLNRLVEEKHSTIQQIGLVFRPVFNIVSALGIVVAAYPAPGWPAVLCFNSAMAYTYGGPRAKFIGIVAVSGTGLTLFFLDTPFAEIILACSTIIVVQVLITSVVEELQERQADIEAALVRQVQIEREKAEAVMMAARSARLASIGQLTAGIAHEINNPLSYVIGSLQCLADCHEDPVPMSDEEILELRADALEGAERIRLIVDGMRNYARQGPVTIAPCDVPKVVTSSVALVQNQLHQTSFSVDMEDGLRSVLADPTRLSQVLVNLLVNAQHAVANQPKPKICLRVRADNGGQIEFNVSDNGHGMEEQVQARIFDPFFTTKGVGKGTGLGLSVVHGIVTEYGGTITVQSILGEGTTFTVKLNATDSEPVQEQTTRPLAPKGLQILILEDEELVSRTLSRSLEGCDLTICKSVADGMEAIDITPDYQVVLCDLMLPGGDGSQILAWLKEHHNELISRIIFMTGGIFQNVDSIEKATKDFPLLTKPISTETLYQTIAHVVASSESAGAFYTTGGH